jgi:methionyl-tRNA synthetase
VPDHILTAVAWPYANGPRHIGHVAGFGVPSDVFARYQRMAGNRVLMVSGTDEHGTPIQVQADAEGVTPRELADRNALVIAKDLQQLGLSYDLFTRTTTKNHYAIAQEIFLGLLKNGYVFAEKQLGAISPSTGRTLPDRYIEGTCPICGYDAARGDQCDNCGNQLDPIDLVAQAAALAAERAEVQPEPARRPQAACLHARPRMGHPGAARRLARPPRQVHLRLVRRRRRLPVRLDRMGAAHR